MANRKHVQIVFSTQAYDRLQNIKNRSGDPTNAAVVRTALRVLDWVLEQREHGAKIQIVKGNSIREVELLL